MGKKRKTKEQKIIAELRRQLSLQTSSSSQTLRQVQDKLPQQTEPEKISFTAQIPVPAQGKTVSAYTQNDYSYLSGGLKKTGILTGLAILLQVVLYFALH